MPRKQGWVQFSHSALTINQNSTQRLSILRNWPRKRGIMTSETESVWLWSWHWRSGIIGWRVQPIHLPFSQIMKTLSILRQPSTLTHFRPAELCTSLVFTSHYAPNPAQKTPRQTPCPHYYASSFCEFLRTVCELAECALATSQSCMKTCSDKKVCCACVPSRW